MWSSALFQREIIILGCKRLEWRNLHLFSQYIEERKKFPLPPQGEIVLGVKDFLKVSIENDGQNYICNEPFFFFFNFALGESKFIIENGKALL